MYYLRSVLLAYAGASAFAPSECLLLDARLSFLVRCKAHTFYIPSEREAGPDLGWGKLGDLIGFSHAGTVQLLGEPTPMTIGFQECQLDRMGSRCEVLE